MAHRKSTNNKHVYRARQRYTDATKEIDTLYIDECETFWITSIAMVILITTASVFYTIV